MGLKEECTLDYEGRTSSGTALLETEELIFRGSYRLKIPFASIHAVDDASERLRVTFGDGQCASFFLPDAEMWARKIRSPKARIDKLGVTTKLKFPLSAESIHRRFYEIARNSGAEFWLHLDGLE